jgi:hypothetical protein
LNMSAISLSPFLGINNRLPEHGLRTKEDGAWLRDAVNVDVQEDGSLKRRAGTRIAKALPGAACGFSTGGAAYVTAGGTLYRFDGSNLQPLCPVSGEVSYAALGDEVYFSDSQQIRRISGNTVLPVTLAPPALPSGQASPSPTARRLVALTAFAGEMESAPCEIQGIIANGTITLPTPDPGVTHYGVYVSGVGGEVLNLLEKRNAGAGTVTLADGAGKPLRDAGCVELPPGLIRFANGRLFSAKENALFWSQPWNFGVFDFVANFALFPAPISILEPCGQGLWIVADQTYFFSAPGQPEASLNAVLPYGALKGASAPSANDSSVYWLSQRGFVRATGDGQALNLTEAAWLDTFSGTGAVLATRSHLVGVSHGE